MLTCKFDWGRGGIEREFEIQLMHVNIFLIQQLETQRCADGLYMKEWGCHPWN